MYNPWNDKVNEYHDDFDPTAWKRDNKFELLYVDEIKKKLHDISY